MPVRMRLATNGASRKRKISIERSPRLVRGVERLLQFVYVVVEKLEVVGDLFFSPNRRRQDEHLAARFARNGVGRFQVEVRLDNDDFDLVALHLLDQLDGMLRTRGNTRSRLYIPDNIEVEMFGEVGPGAVVGNDFAAGVGLHGLEPFLVGLLEAPFEVGVALFKISGVAGTHLAELVGDAFGDA